MCGFAGALDDGRDRGNWDGVLAAMSGAIAHRGPDDAGTFVDPEAGIGLAHRRLAILDLSPEGHQPMVSHGGRWVIAYNGEVYNFAEIRRELDRDGAPPWRGRSDTEVILAAIERWGLAEALPRFVGMFAFALWDRRDRVLHLVRDRLGIKPLYHGLVGGAFVFASELSAIRRYPGFDRAVDRDALAAFLRHNYVPAPRSIHRGISKLRPGTMLAVSADGRERETVWWSLPERVRLARAAPFRGDETAAADELERLLGDAVRLRTVSDVPLGAFLSGGIDSSLVVALLQKSAGRPVRTFTIGFEERGYDESPHARRVADHLGTDHTERVLSAADALALIPRIPTIWDEPFSDSSQIPTLLVSRVAREAVTVSLSGDGGDELFAGYARYELCREIWRRIGRLPGPLRGAIAAGLRGAPRVALDVALAWTRPWIRRYGSDGPPSDKAAKLAEMLSFRGPRDLYLDLVSHWKRPDELVPGASEPDVLGPAWEAAPPGATLTETMMHADTTTYLPDDILVKVDRASMHVGLEARVPLLDHRVVEFAWSVPERFRVRGREGKLLLRRVLDRHVPRALIDRPKMGFGIPLDRWLRGPLRGWAEDLLDPKSLAADDLLDPAPIRARWEEHLSGRRDWHYYLWDVLVFQTWRAAQ